MVESQKVAVVTGSSSGIGFETSLALARSGYLTYATMRNLQKSKVLEGIAQDENLSLKAIEMDVDCDLSVKNAIDRIIDESGRIDVLVNNAGFGLFGSLEDLEMGDIKRQFETNVFGVIRVTKNVLPTMRLRQYGIIVNISSIAGLAGIPSQTMYCGTKFAVEGLSESLSFEVEPFGIKVIIVEPGVINTEFARDLIVPTSIYRVDENGKQINSVFPKDKNDASLLSPYSNTIGKFLSFYYKAMSDAPHPKAVADETIKAIEKVSRGNNAEPILRVTVGEESKKYSELKREISDSEFHKILREDLLG
jgi:NAD(P)-dependent dehydrogenase (short-subunit alcohol dehydrogenase family)